MGLFDSISSLANAANLLKDTDGNGQIQAVDLVRQLVQQNGGNFGALLGQLQQGDLASTVQSWIGNGTNAPADAAQIQNALGGGLQEAAAKLGLDANQAGNLLAQHLPQIINTLTPNGTAADANGFGLDDIARLVIGNFLKK
ncbi:YidB family protein [Conchiformibius kuhniae]|uniref:YidB family protein n=1 Tax=Conchiformibius kuhniae TaxID=211502 RepID=A0A8T9MUQ1_9NEIS|nr:YidB family protein [Conchiformibius kuhniae]UOP04844.1 YidB family protein [Conchiformibius kuhniae]